MYNLILNIILFASLALIFYQDLKNRQIHVVLPVILFGVGIFSLFVEKIEFSMLLQNSLFLTITLLFAYLYLIFKNKGLLNPFKTLIGIGDIIFFIAVLPFFCLKNYILYFVTGMVFSILSFLLIRTFNNNVKTVPLAGLLAIYLVFLKLLSFSTNKFQFFNPVI